MRDPNASPPDDEAVRAAAASGDLAPQELRQRVIYSLFMPAVRLARHFGIELKELSRWLELAYFHEARNSGQNLQETAEALGISHRTAVRLARELREHFFAPELRHDLPRRIEFMLATQPMSSARIRQVLDARTEDIDAALRDLEQQGRIQSRAGRTATWEVATRIRRLPRDTWRARVAALNSFAVNMADAVFGRFFRDEPRAFARTLSFHVPAERAARLNALYEDVLLPAIVELSADDPAAGDTESVQLSICWAPYDYLENLEDPQS